MSLTGLPRKGKIESEDCKAELFRARTLEENVTVRSVTKTG